jgi:acetylornithine deacetylase/succinyl-diaminopimelate desuccinylase-like protein
VWARPTLDVNGFIGGFTGEGEKTVIAARGSAKVSMRLVPDQDAGEILGSLRAYVARLTTPGVKVEVELLGSAPPVLAGADHRGARALAAAFEAAFDQPAVHVRTGGTIPVSVDFQQALGAPLMISGLSQPGGGAHGPNEHLSLDHFHRGTEALIRLFWGLAG